MSWNMVNYINKFIDKLDLEELSGREWGIKRLSPQYLGATCIGIYIFL